MGTRRIARVLARAGLHLGRTTVRRMLQPVRKQPKEVLVPKAQRVVRARGPNHIWHVDLTTVPSFGFWIPWLPLALPQRWPFSWWVAVAVDHYFRRVMGTAVFPSTPSARDVARLLAPSAGKAAADRVTSSRTTGVSSSRASSPPGVGADVSGSASAPSGSTRASPLSSAASGPSRGSAPA